MVKLFWNLSAWSQVTETWLGKLKIITSKMWKCYTAPNTRGAERQHFCFMSQETLRLASITGFHFLVNWMQYWSAAIYIFMETRLLGRILEVRKKEKVLTFSWASKISRSACQDVMSPIQSIVSLLVPGPGYIYTAANEFFIVNGEPWSPQPQPTHRKETFINQKA